MLESITIQLERNELHTRWGPKEQDRYSNVDIEEFITGEEFLGPLLKETDDGSGNKVPGLWPCHKEDLILLNDFRRTHDVDLFVDIEAIGSGKSFKAATFASWGVFEIYTTPQFYQKFRMAPGSEVSIICMGRTAAQSKDVTYRKVLPFLYTDFMKKYFPPKFDIAKFEAGERFPGMLQLPGNKFIFPGTGNAGRALGYSPYIGIVDEANHLQLTAESKRAEGIAYGGKYDAAEQIFTAIGGRIGSRFRLGGKNHGAMIMMSDPRFVGDFLERRFEESSKAKDFYRVDKDRFVGGKTFCVRRDHWTAKPWAYCGETFKFDTDKLVVIE